MFQTFLLLVLTGLSSPSPVRKRFYHVIKENKTWSEAEKFCKKHYTDLATVSMKTIVSCICPDKSDCENAWVKLNCTQSKEEWKLVDTGDHYEPDDWGDNSNQEEGNCAYSILLDLFKGSCEEEKYFTCQYKNGPHPSNHNATWCDALQFCRSQQATLFNDLNQNQKDSSRHEKQGVDSSQWVGLFRAPCWEDEFCSKQSFTCAKAGANDNWEKDDCNKPRPFICYENHMVLVREEKTWEEAFYHCRQNYGELAMMEDEHELRKVQARAKMADTDFVWVGLHFSCFFEEWLWVDGRWVSSDHKNWKNRNEEPDCDVSGAMEKNGERKWVKRPSGGRYHFVCSVRC